VRSPRAIERHRWCRIAQNLGVPDGRQDVVLVDAAQDAIQTQRRGRGKLDGFESVGRFEGDAIEQVEQARADLGRLKQSAPGRSNQVRLRKRRHARLVHVQQKGLEFAEA
jgi:hypothetical protein